MPATPTVARVNRPRRASTPGAVQSGRRARDATSRVPASSASSPPSASNVSAPLPSRPSTPAIPAGLLRGAYGEPEVDRREWTAGSRPPSVESPDALADVVARLSHVAWLRHRSLRVCATRVVPSAANTILQSLGRPRDALLNNPGKGRLSNAFHGVASPASDPARGSLGLETRLGVRGETPPPSLFSSRGEPRHPRESRRSRGAPSHGWRQSGSACGGFGRPRGPSLLIPELHAGHRAPMGAVYGVGPASRCHEGTAAIGPFTAPTREEHSVT